MTKTQDLYRIVMGPTVWTLAQDQRVVYDVGFGSEVFVKTAMGRNTIEQKNEISKAGLEITIPIDHEIAISLLTSYSEQIMGLTVFTKRGEIVETSWKGRLVSISPGDEKLAMNFESVFTSMRRPGLRARFQRSCRHPVYGRGCNLDRNAFDVAATISAIVGNTLTVPQAALQADGYYSGGMIAAADGSLSFVIAHVGTALTLQRVGYSLISDFSVSGPGTPISIYPGCDHTRATCSAKFGNILNYGGFDWIPRKNPMAGSSIV